MTPAHDGQQTIRVLIHYPEHSIRASDPYHAEFEAAIKRLKDQGLYKCVVCGTDQNVEMHHSTVEYAMQNAVDLDKINEHLGLHLTDADFAEWIDSPANLEPLCTKHHRGAEGIHVSPEPLWELLRITKNADLFESKGNI